MNGFSLLRDKDAQLRRYRFGLRVAERGVVASVGDGIAWITGLPSAAIGDTLGCEDGSWAVVYDLTETRIGAILLQQTATLTAGAVVRRSASALSIPVGDALIGRVIDPIGQALDGLGPIDTVERRPLDGPAPPIVARDFVREPLYTGIKSIDALVPIGKGQRQLVIGDEGSGKSALALDTVISQRGRNVLCVYVLIGQKRSDVVRTIETLRAHRALDYCAVVVGEAGALPGLNYLAPFAGCALAEAWMAEGRDTLIVYDDLTTHARTYRELSLLLRRPPGREAYPGDIFYLHSRLLERATCMGGREGGGSMTALPLVETSLGEISAYIPTNLISITDGQIYLDAGLFASGLRPAVDITRSVSRIGGRAQHPRIKDEAGRMKLDYLQYLELEVFTRFGAKLEPGMALKIRRGRQLRELLRQERLSPVDPEAQLAWLTAFNEGFFDAVDVGAVVGLQRRLLAAAVGSGLSLDDSRTRWVEWLSAQVATRSGAGDEPTA